MKTGVIIYLMGETQLARGNDIQSKLRQLEPDVEQLEVVVKDARGFSIGDARWALNNRGMQRNVCIVGEINESEGLRFKPEPPVIWVRGDVHQSECYRELIQQRSISCQRSERGSPDPNGKKCQDIFDPANTLQCQHH